jgi:predicted CXXCH cytochrome family protein
MTRAATPAAVLGDFGGVVLEDRGYQWRFERRGDEFWVEMPDPLWFNEPPGFMRTLYADWPEVPPRFEARVVMTTGSHHMQNYWVRRPSESSTPLGPDTGALVQVPWVWLIAEQRWIPNRDSFLGPPSAELQGVTPWNATCSQCHSVGTRPGLLDFEGRYETRTVELGVACEACHGPAAEHVRRYRSPLRRYLQHLRAGRDPDVRDPSVVNPAKLEPHRSVDVCAQCHSFGEWTDQRAYGTDGIPFRPGTLLSDVRSVFRYTEDLEDPMLAEILGSDPLALRGNFWRDGTIRVAGREYNGLLEDVHLESDLTCLSCHSMHAYDSPNDQLATESAGDRSCLGCHAEYVGRVTEHTRHGPRSSGSECMNCHMPHTTYGLFSATRSHRIDSPSVRASVETGRPNACNLCHLDRSLDWSGRWLTAWYGQPVPELSEDERQLAASVLWTLSGDAAQRAVVAWNMGWSSAREASGDTWMAAYLAQLLTDPYAAVRQVAYRSLAGLPGFEALAYDYLAPDSEREDGAGRATEIWLASASSRPAEPALLLTQGGAPDVAEWLRLLAARDERPLAIVE